MCACVCVCECAHCQWFLLSLVLFRVAFFFLFSYMYFCQTVTIFGYTSWAPLMPVFARSFAVGNRQLCLSLMMFRRDKGKYFQVMLECVLFFGTSACTSKSHYPYIPYTYIYTYVFVFINQREFSWINVSLSADAECACVSVSCVEDNGGANWPIDSGGESSLQTENYNKK